MENSSSASLKKLKREAAQRRKAQARSLKLRAEEQERLQRLEIDELVEQQRLQRLERQRCEEDAARLAQQQKAAVFNSSSGDNNNNNNNNNNNQQQHQHPAAGSQISDGKHASCKGSTNCKQVLQASSRSCSNNMLADEKSDKSDIAAAATVAGGWRGKESQRAKQVQQQSMRAAVESRRRLARGPRSGVPDNAHGGANNLGPILPSEDHRIVSTEYQAAGTQALMRVTLLAAGFVIGARGISARLIGQVTGAIVQSWTESCRPDLDPIRLFRIQGKKGVVQAAVHLIEQAVAKYKDLCDCKRRGEFVQREHIINGVEFYYQPPPRKAFVTPADQPPGSAGNCCNSGGKQLKAVDHGSGQANCNGQVGVAPAQQLPFAPHHVWLQQHLQQQQHNQAQAAAIHHETNQVHEGHGQNHRSMGRSQYAFFDWQTQQTQVAQQQQQQQQQQKVNADQVEREDAVCASELELIDQGLKHSAASLEQALQQVRLEQRILQHNRGVAADSAERNGKQVSDNSMWSENAQIHEKGPVGTFKLGSSLFSIFGNGGLPLPITSQDGTGGLQADTPSTPVSMFSTNPAAVSTTPFGFPTCDFLRETLPAFQFSAAARNNGFVPEYSLYESPVNKMESIIDDKLCIVCLEQPAGVRLMELVDCPLCHERIVGLHQIGRKAISPCIASSPGAPGALRVSSAPGVGAKRNGSSSYHLWNWVPGASL